MSAQNLEAIAQAFYAIHACVESIAISHASIANDVKRIVDAAAARDASPEQLAEDVAAMRNAVEHIDEYGVPER